MSVSVSKWECERVRIFRSVSSKWPYRACLSAFAVRMASGGELECEVGETLRHGKTLSSSF